MHSIYLVCTWYDMCNLVYVPAHEMQQTPGLFSLMYLLNIQVHMAFVVPTVALKPPLTGTLWQIVLPDVCSPWNTPNL